MLDIAALPIAFALTLWDALPIFLAIAAASSILARATLRDQSFHRVWLLRETAAIEGIVYGLIFMPLLAIPLAIGSITMSLSPARRSPIETTVPPTPILALRERAGEIVYSLLLACSTAAIIKIGAPAVPANLGVQTLVALAAGMIAGHRSGVVIIPAVAIAVHLGGTVPAFVCIVGGWVLPLLRGQVRPRNAATS